MPLAKLQIAPTLAGYAYEDGQENVEIKLDGGASRKRTDILNAASMVSIEWDVRMLQFEYLRAFFNTTLVRGAESFLIDLPIDSPYGTEVEAQFIGGLKHIVTGGGGFRVTATLEVLRADTDADYDAALVALVNAFGPSQAAIDTGLLSLEHLVNVDLPTTEPV